MPAVAGLMVRTTGRIPVPSSPQFTRVTGINQPQYSYSNSWVTALEDQGSPSGGRLGRHLRRRGRCLRPQCVRGPGTGARPVQEPRGHEMGAEDTDRQTMLAASTAVRPPSSR